MGQVSSIALHRTDRRFLIGRDLIADAPYDEGAARVVDGTDGDPERILQKVDNDFYRGLFSRDEVL